MYGMSAPRSGPDSTGLSVVAAASLPLTRSRNPASRNASLIIASSANRKLPPVNGVAYHDSTVVTSVMAKTLLSASAFRSPSDGESPLDVTAITTATSVAMLSMSNAITVET